MITIGSWLDAFERLFFALFGLQRPEDLKMNNHVEDWTLQIFKLIFGAYLLMAGIVLINLLIAMMSDTYQRIQVWIDFMNNKTETTFRPNLLVQTGQYMYDQ